MSGEGESDSAVGGGDLTHEKPTKTDVEDLIMKAGWFGSSTVPEAPAVTQVSEADPSKKWQQSEKMISGKYHAAKISRKHVGRAENIVYIPKRRASDDEDSLADEAVDDPEQEERRFKSTFTEFMLYLLLLIVISYVTVSTVPYSRYHFFEAFTHFLVDSDFDTDSGISKNFWDIKILDQIWDYMSGILIPLVYSSVNNRLAAMYATNLNQDLLMINENILVVKPRIRQLRVKNDSCEIPLGFKYVFDSCYNFFTADTEDKESFGSKNATHWKWSDETVTKALPITGEISTYTGGGFFMDFAGTLNATKEIYDDMWANTWINHGSRAIVIDMVSYTQRDNLFCIVTLLFEIPPSGGVVTSGDIRVQKLLRYVSLGDFLILGFEIAFIVLLLVVTILLAIKLFTSRLRFFRNMWNNYHLLLALFGYSTIGVGISRYVIVESHLKDLPEAMRNKEYFSFHEVRDIQTAFEVMLGFLTLMVWISMLKYLALVRPGALILRAFYNVRTELVALSIMLLLLIFGFAMFSHVIFGTHVEEFNTLGNSMFTLIALFSGGLYFYNACEEARPMLAPAFFVVYIFVVILLFLNWFAASIVHGLKLASKDMQKLKNAQQVYLSDYLRKHSKKMFTMFKLKRLYDAVVDTQKSEESDFHKLVKILKKEGFCVLERALFLKRHGITDEAEDIPKEKLDDIVADLNGMNNMYIEVEEHAIVLEKIDSIKKRLEVLDHTLYDMMVKIEVLVDKKKADEEAAKQAKS